jgi:predicted MFS family arabinose efflux permease
MTSTVTRGAEAKSGRALPPAASFAAMTAAFAAFFIAAGAPTPLLPIYEANWHFPASMVTVAFGVYAIALLLTLLVIGSLSDHIGRRPLLIGALALELVSMLVFLVSPSISWIIAARVIQGVATAAATSSFSAAILELAPGKRKQLAGVITGLAPAAGIGVGALFSGVIAQFSSSAAATVWIILAAVMLAGLASALFTPETATRKPGAVASLRPQVSVPPAARRVFAVTLPSLIAAWLLSALFLGLMPTILRLKFGISSPVVSGFAAFAEQGTGGAVAVALSKMKPQRLVFAGGLAIVAGIALFIGSVAATSLPLLWTGAVIGGAGLGGAFTGTIRSLVPLVEAQERAGLFSAIYLVSYLTFGIPVIVAGLLLSSIGVTAIALIFGAVTVVAAAAGVVTQLATARCTSGPGPQQIP